MTTQHAIRQALDSAADRTEKHPEALIVRVLAFGLCLIVFGWALGR